MTARHMKWWGWGEEGVSFRYDDRGALADVSERSLREYDVVKRANQQGFMDAGGTLSHHHAVGVEHASWLGQDISPVGVTMIRSLLDGVDPSHNFNPGKIV
jgi:alkyldihydroxyacetonephosphate synthase